MTAIAELAPKASNPTAGYLAVQVGMLQRLQHATVDLFVQYEPNGSPVLYHRAGCPIETNQLSGLAEAGVQHIFVRTEDFQQFGTQLLESVDSLVGERPVPGAERFAVLQVALAMEIERTSRLVDCGPYVALAEKVGRDLTALLAASKVLPKDLFRLARHDFNTFTHVTNVAGYSVILAEQLGLCGADELEQIATAAILHDIGKRFIPSEILTKPSRLDPHERDVIETHPQRGYEELCQRPGLDARSTDDRLSAPRTDRRDGISRRHSRRRNPSLGADAVRCRRIRRNDGHTTVPPPGYRARGHELHPAERRYAVRSRGCSMLDINHDKQLIDDTVGIRRAESALDGSLQNGSSNSTAPMPVISRQSPYLSSLFHARQGSGAARRCHACRLHERRFPPRDRLSVAGAADAEGTGEAAPAHGSIELGNSPLSPRGSRMLRVRRPICLGARLDSVHELR